MQWLVEAIGRQQRRVGEAAQSEATKYRFSLILPNHSEVFWFVMEFMETVKKRLFSSDAEEVYILQCLSYVMILMAAVTCFTFLFQNVPYGRYTSSKYGFPVHVKVAWFVQELPAFLLPLSLILWASPLKITELPNQLLLGMYFCHYVQR